MRAREEETSSEMAHPAGFRDFPENDMAERLVIDHPHSVGGKGKDGHPLPQHPPPVTKPQDHRRNPSLISMQSSCDSLLNSPLNNETDHKREEVELDALYVALNTRSKLGNSREIVDTLRSISHIHFTRNEIEQSLIAIRKALKIYEKYLVNDPNFVETINEKGKIYLHTNDLDKALQNFRKSLRILSSDKDFPNILAAGDTFHNIGIANFRLHEFDNALEAMSVALDILNNISTEDAKVADILNDIGEIYEAQGFVEESVSYFKESIIIYKSLLLKSTELIARKSTKAMRQAKHRPTHRPSLSLQDVQMALLSEQLSLKGIDSGKNTENGSCRNPLRSEV